MKRCKYSQKQVFLISCMLVKFQSFYEKHAHKLEMAEFDFAGITYKVWKKDLEEINEIINCIDKAL